MYKNIKILLINMIALYASFAYSVDINTFEGLWSKDCEVMDSYTLWKKIDNNNYKVTFFNSNKITQVSDAFDFQILGNGQFEYKMRHKIGNEVSGTVFYKMEFVNKNERNTISARDNDGDYIVQDGVLVKSGNSTRMLRCMEVKTQNVKNPEDVRVEKITSVPNKRKEIVDLENQLKLLSSNYNRDVSLFTQYRCYGWTEKYASREMCMTDNDFNSVAWENYLKREVSNYQKAKIDKANAAASRERCLSNGPIGICQSSKQNELMYLCASNLVTGLQNLTNQYCYVTDENHISARMEVKNNTSQSIRDIHFVCEQIANSGTVLGKNSQTVFDVWKPGEIRTVTLKFLKHQQVNNLRCNPVQWK